jgi:RNA polymerase sigma-70 factor (ECF subfamily)
MRTSDEDLWLMVRKGNADAFADLYRLYAPVLRRFLHLYLGNTQAEDDVTQEVFLRLWRSPNGFEAARAPLKRYLFGVARRCAADWWRHRPPSPPPGPPADVQMPTAEADLLLQSALGQLDPEARTLLWLRQGEGYSYAELAGIYQIPIGTVRSRLFAARETLREAWSGEGGPPKAKE